MDQSSRSLPNVSGTRRWCALDRVERRVLGVLVEKAKTTPDNYPLSLNALKNGCNQKSNRFPSMLLDEDEVENAIERLREKGAVAVIQGGARVDKYRHLAYDWLGVDKIELAVMGELLLRGAQTIGELRGRAARMEPIKDLGELRPILDSLVEKRLVVFLTPEGRGAVATHNLYQSHELEKVRKELGSSSVYDPVSPHAALPPGSSRHSDGPQDDQRMAASLVQQSGRPSSAVHETQSDIAGLKANLDDTRREFAAFREEVVAALDELQAQLNDLNQQLGNS